MVNKVQNIRRLGVVGAGTMGHGIAQASIQAGVETLLYDVDDTALSRGHSAIEQRLDALVSRDRISIDERNSALSRLTITRNLGDFSSVDGVIEAAPEVLELKQELFRELDRVCIDAQFIATNTSSDPIQDLVLCVQRKERVLGMHYFNPASVLKLVEVVVPLTVSSDVVETAERFCRATGKVTVRVKDTPAFIVNRLLIPFLLDAIRMLESGIASAEDIDVSCRLGLGHSLGPLSTCDLVGLDVLLNITESMFDELRDSRVVPPTLLRRMVAAGQLGKKSGIGFFEYSNLDG